MAPWQKQIRQITGIVIVALAIFGVAMLYLSVSESMTDIKLQLEVMQDTRNEYAQRIADLITDRGMLTSYNTMKKRAEKAGYREIDYQNDSLYRYMIVDGYSGTGIRSRETRIPGNTASDSLMRPEYTQSLQQWLAERIAIGKESYEIDY